MTELSTDSLYGVDTSTWPEPCYTCSGRGCPECDPREPDDFDLAALDIPNRVARGVAWMDERYPDWWREDCEHPIDTNVLDMNSPRKCLLGQIHGSFYNSPICTDEAVALGFDSDDMWPDGFGTDFITDDDERLTPVQREFAELTEQFAAVIAFRRGWDSP